MVDEFPEEEEKPPLDVDDWLKVSIHIRNKIKVIIIEYLTLYNLCVYVYMLCMLYTFTDVFLYLKFYFILLLQI